MKIDNVKVYGLGESIVASGLPMVEEYDGASFDEDATALKLLRRKYECLDVVTGGPVDVDDLCKAAEREEVPFLSRHLKRAKSLASCAGGESHDCFLAGVVVQCNVTAPRYWFPEMQRYSFIYPISSTSTMHRLKKLCKKAIEIKQAGGGQALADLINAHFSKATWPVIIDDFLSFAEARMKQTDVNVEELKANLPNGWLQTMRISTNYRQFRTIIRQRHNHGLKEWRDFCAWIETLPMAKDLILGGMKQEEDEQ